MGLIPTPDGTCARDKILHEGGITCWVAVIPAQPVAGQFDNSHGGTGFMLGSLDFYGSRSRCPHRRQPDRGVGVDWSVHA